MIANIRNQMDYSPHAIYWLGGELAQNKEFEWVDGSPMSYMVKIYIYILLCYKVKKKYQIFRVGYQAKILLIICLLNQHVLAYNGKHHPHLCYHLVYIGHHNDVQNMVVMYVKVKNKKFVKLMYKIKQ